MEIPIMVSSGWRGSEEGENKLNDALEIVNDALRDYDRAGTALTPGEHLSECTVYVKCHDKQNAAAAAEAVKARLIESEDVWLATMPLGNNTVTGPDRSRRYKGRNGGGRTDDTRPQGRR